MADLQEIVRQRILNEVVGLRKGNSSHSEKLQWKLLIVDDITLKVVSACLQMAQLATEGVSNVEHIHKHREPNSLSEAIYFVTPNTKNIDAILLDVNDKFYKAFHIMFSETCPKSLLNCVLSKVTRPNLIKSCKQVYLSFIPVEKHVYSISVKPILPPLDPSSSEAANKGITE